MIVKPQNIRSSPIYIYLPNTEHDFVSILGAYTSCIIASSRDSSSYQGLGDDRSQGAQPQLSNPRKLNGCHWSQDFRIETAQQGGNMRKPTTNVSTGDPTLDTNQNGQGPFQLDTFYVLVSTSHLLLAGRPKSSYVFFPLSYFLLPSYYILLTPCYLLLPASFLLLHISPCCFVQFCSCYCYFILAGSY